MIYGGRLPQYYKSYGAPGYKGAPLQVLRLKETDERSGGADLGAALTCFIVPWVFFVVLYLCVALPVHFLISGLTIAVEVLGAVAVVALGVLVLRARAAQDHPLMCQRCFLCASLLVAYIVAVVLGSNLYSKYIYPYEELQKLNVYVHVDPSTTSGNEVVDAGLISFTQDTRVDVSKSMSFKEGGVYCVAPIVAGSATARYDFWAVGKGCCADGGFTCAKEPKPPSAAPGQEAPALASRPRRRRGGRGSLTIDGAAAQLNPQNQDEAAPAVEEAAPAVEEAAPAVEEAAPAVEDDPSATAEVNVTSEGPQAQGHGYYPGGLRLLSDDDRAFYRLAVQKAEAAHKIRAQHPLFFTWTLDPKAELNRVRRAVGRAYFIGIAAFGAWQLLLVGCAALYVWKRTGF